jgi:hypothetical protein
MSLFILDSDGDPEMELKYGKPPTPSELGKILEYTHFVQATGLELDECKRILGRPDIRGRPAMHIFGRWATEEIALNWGK